MQFTVGIVDTYLQLAINASMEAKTYSEFELLRNSLLSVNLYMRALVTSGIAFHLPVSVYTAWPYLMFIRLNKRPKKATVIEGKIPVDK